MTKNLTLLIFNTLSYVVALYLNHLYGAGVGEKKSVGEISNQYDTLITPAGYAFSIWGLIYLLLLGFIIFLWISQYYPIFLLKTYFLLFKTMFLFI